MQIAPTSASIARIAAKNQVNKDSIANQPNLQNPNFGAYLQFDKSVYMLEFPTDFFNKLSQLLLKRFPNEAIKVKLQNIASKDIYTFTTQANSQCSCNYRDSHCFTAEEEIQDDIFDMLEKEQANNKS